MSRFLVIAAATGSLLMLGSAFVPATAATDAEALQCGVAVNKFTETILKELGKAGTKRCKSPDDAAEVVAKLVTKLNKKAETFNSKYDDAVCDPDLADLLPVQAVTAMLAETLLNNTFLGGSGGIAPADFECNNMFDDP